MAFQLGPGGRGKSGSGGFSWQWILMLGVVAGGGVVGWLVARGVIGMPSHESAEIEIDPRPVIVSLQKVGELHTVKMNMKDVLRKSSDRPAEGWLRGLPGGDAVSRWATHNEVLVVAEGSVEAGVDLSSITSQDVLPSRLKDGTAGLRVRLPRPVIYTPNVKLHVVNSETGFAWKDEDLIPKAEVEASRRFLDAAEKDNIREHAKENAVQQLQQMEQSLGVKNVEFFY